MATTPVRRRLVPSPRWRKRLALAGLLVVFVGLAPWGWVKWISRGSVTDVTGADRRPVALVLGAGLTSSGKPTPFLAARLDVAVELHRTGKATVLLVSGDNRTHDYDEPTAMFDYLVAHDVPAADIVRDYAGRDTYDSCARALRIFGVERLALVSQGYHLPRAVATCRSLGLDARGVGDRVMEKRYPQLWTSYTWREVAASWKTVLDVVTGRDPVLGNQETSVRDALARHRVND